MTTLLSVFFTVFFAELGDKTQLATILFAADDNRNKLLVYGAAAFALVLSTAVAVLLGTAADRWLGELPLKLIAGTGFVLIGTLMIAGYFQPGG